MDQQRLAMGMAPKQQPQASPQQQQQQPQQQQFLQMMQNAGIMNIGQNGQPPGVNFGGAGMQNLGMQALQGMQNAQNLQGQQGIQGLNAAQGQGMGNLMQNAANLNIHSAQQGLNIPGVSQDDQARRQMLQR